MSRAIMLTAFAVLALAVVPAAGQISNVLSYQGVLKDGGGVPVPDGAYTLAFNLYDVATGGVVLWAEVQSVDVEDGVFSVLLGDASPFSGVDFDVPYWLGISVDGAPELAPRTRFASVPYAVHAAYADEALSADDGDWKITGTIVYNDWGDVGIGTSTPDGAFDVQTGGRIAGDFSNGSLDNFGVRVRNVGGSAGGFMVGTDPFETPAISAAVYGRGGIGARGGYFYSDGSEEALVVESATGAPALSASALGNGYAAVLTGGMGVYTDGFVDMGGFRMGPGAAPGYVLTADASGGGTWQPAAAGGDDGDWTIAGSDMYATPIGKVGIGTSSPIGKLEVSAIHPDEALRVVHHDATPRVATIERTSIPAAGDDALQISIPFGSPDGCQLIEAERGGVPVFYVMGDGRVIGPSGAYFGDLVEVDNGRLLVDYYGDRVVEISTVYTQSGAHVLHVEAPDGGLTDDGIAVYGKYEQANDFGIGGKFEGGYIGVWGVADYYGGTSEHVGVRAAASGSSTYNYGILASGGGGGTSYAGYFEGHVEITGTLTADTKNFKIDHPLDPANKYLIHSCVESDEMKNVYDGVTELDANGEARIELPEWFEAVNGEYRYQLTCIGGYAPVYIAREIEDGAFMIAGGEPAMKVSWQVTGVRHDPYALAHRAEVVQDKPSMELGTYRHPELYGMPETAGVMYREERGVAAQEGLTERSSIEDFTISDEE